MWAVGKKCELLPWMYRYAPNRGRGLHFRHHGLTNPGDVFLPPKDLGFTRNGFLCYHVL